MTTKSGGDFWSRRRAAVRQAEQQAKEQEAAKVEIDKAEQLAELTDEQALEQLGLPDPDALEQGADFTPFMEKVVPERLRRRALRRLWRLNPALANLDGLIEYGEDYTDAATVVENLQTTYQVGKGMLKHVEYLAEQAKKRELAASAAGAKPGEPEPGAEPQDTTSPSDETVAANTAESAETESGTIADGDTAAATESQTGEHSPINHDTQAGNGAPLQIEHGESLTAHNFSSRTVHRDQRLETPGGDDADNQPLSLPAERPQPVRRRMRFS